MTNAETRTVAFQVSAELFEEFKDYLQRHGMKQKDFFLSCIQRALANEEHADGAGQDEPQGEDK